MAWATSGRKVRLAASFAAAWPAASCLCCVSTLCLSHSITCPAVQKKKTSTWSALLVVGTATGDVKAYDSALGELKWRARSVLEG